MNKTAIAISLIAATVLIASVGIYCSMNRYYMLHPAYLVDKMTGDVWFVRGTRMTLIKWLPASEAKQQSEPQGRWRK